MHADAYRQMLDLPAVGEVAMVLLDIAQLIGDADFTRGRDDDLLDGLPSRQICQGLRFV